MISWLKRRLLQRRINRILNEAGWPSSRSIFTGNVTVTESNCTCGEINTRHCRVHAPC